MPMIVIGHPRTPFKLAFLLLKYLDNKRSKYFEDVTDEDIIRKRFYSIPSIFQNSLKY